MALPEANDFFGWVAYILNEYGSMLLSGAWKTMVIAVISTAIGCVIGFAVGIVQTIPTNRQVSCRLAKRRVLRLRISLASSRLCSMPM